MAKFNKKLPKTKTLTENLAGGQAYSQTSELKLVSTLLTSFVNNEFYRDTKDTLNELKRLVKEVNPEFVAKSAIYARDKFGMRSITHALAGELSSEISGKDWSKDFYEKVVVRVDDMNEILSYYLCNKTNSSSPKFPNSIKKGFAKAFDKFDNYQLAKYKSTNREVKLVDIVNLVHPVPTERNRKALEDLIKGELKSTETWESKLSEAGTVAKDKEDLAKLKSEAWSELISKRKIGYFALLKNLRNIITQSPESIDDACELLTDRKMIKKSRVLPFRFTTAFDEVQKIGQSSEVRTVLTAINQAIDIAIENVPVFPGETLVVVDVSGSMKSVSGIAALFGSVIAKANNCDVMTFSNSANYVNYNPNDTLTTIRDSFVFTRGGTNFKSIFETANKKYDRVIILSDMQHWVGYFSPVNAYREYCDRFSTKPFVYSWDLKGYGTMQFPESNVFSLAGFSEKVFDIMSLLESDKTTLIEEINSIQL